MSRIVSATALAALVAATTHEPQVNVTCSGESDLIIDIGYDRSVNLLKLVGGSCNETTVDYSQNNVTNAVQIKMDMRDCGLRSAGRLEGEAIAFESVVDVSLGRSDGGIDVVFYNNKVNLICTVRSDYEVSLSYGEIDADYSSDEAMAGGEKAFTFGIRSTDSDFNETVVPSNRAGDKVYLDVYSNDVDFYQYKFGLKSCTFKEMDGANTVTEYNLFNHTENSCKNNFLDFSINYCNDTSSFKITHTVFTFDPSRQNNYTLSCSIKLCDFEVAASNSQCEAIENNCGIDTIMPKEASSGDVATVVNTTLPECPDMSTRPDLSDEWEFKFRSTVDTDITKTATGCNGIRTEFLNHFSTEQNKVDDALEEICRDSKLMTMNAIMVDKLKFGLYEIEWLQPMKGAWGWVDMEPTNKYNTEPFNIVCRDMCTTHYNVEPTTCADPPALPECPDMSTRPDLSDEWEFKFRSTVDTDITKTATGCNGIRTEFLNHFSSEQNNPVDDALEEICRDSKLMTMNAIMVDQLKFGLYELEWLQPMKGAWGWVDMEPTNKYNDMPFNIVCRDMCTTHYNVEPTTCVDPPAPQNCTNAADFDSMVWQFKATMSTGEFSTDPGCNGWYESWRTMTTDFDAGLSKICETATLGTVNSVTEFDMYYRVQNVFVDAQVLDQSDSRLDTPFKEVCQDLCASALEVNPTGCVASPKPLPRCVDHEGNWGMEFDIVYRKVSYSKAAMGCSDMRLKFLEVISPSEVDSTIKFLCESPNTMDNLDGWLGVMGVSTASIKLDDRVLTPGDAEMDLRFNEVCQDFCSWMYDVQAGCIKN